MFVKKHTVAEAPSPRLHISGSVLFIVALILTLSNPLLFSCKARKVETAAQPVQSEQRQESRRPENAAGSASESPAVFSAAPRAVQQNAATSTGSGNESTGAAVSMQQRPRPQATAASDSGTVTVAPTLGGSDRHLIHRPLDRILPDDFIIGNLQNPETASQAVSGLLQTTIQSLKQGELPTGLLSPEISLLTSVLYAADLKAADAAKEIRLGAIQNGRGGILEIPFRLIGEAYRSRGLMVIDPSANPPTIIHFSFNNSGLNESYTALESFDPHGVLY